MQPGELWEDAAWAVELLEVAPPHRLKPGERQRVLLGLGRARVVTRRTWPLRLAATVTALVAATAIARAGLGHLPGWLTRLSGGTRPSSQADGHVLSSGIRHRKLAAATVAPERQITTPPAPVADPVPVVDPAPVPGPAVAEAPRVTASANRPARRPATTPAARPERDTELVVQAIRALHHDGDPTLARALCTAYLQRHPDGPLAEEALALTIEAAVAQHEPDASALGARYLQRYPTGPFRGLARQASQPGTGRSR
jgi:hypothetical protein